jgi:hypothetical protein
MIETEGIYALATALKINTTLTRLDFSGNKGIGAGYGLIREILKTGSKMARISIKFFVVFYYYIYYYIFLYYLLHIYYILLHYYYIIFEV